MAISSTAVFGVRSSGSDTNGGFYNPSGSAPGADFSMADTPTISVTDAVANGTTTITSATAGFVTGSSGHNRNGIYIGDPRVRQRSRHRGHTTDGDDHEHEDPDWPTRGPIRLSMSAPLDLIFGDDFGVGEPVVPPIEEESSCWGMIPFPDLMYPDRVRVRRKTNVASGGRLKHTYGAPGDPVMASVESIRVERTDTSGRVTVRTMHVVSTDNDLMLNAEDMLVWTDHNGITRNLLVDGPSIPQGICDVAYSTDTFEIV
jgi:hypothetical protein